MRSLAHINCDLLTVQDVDMLWYYYYAIFPPVLKHLSCDDCLVEGGKIIWTVMCCLVYRSKHSYRSGFCKCTV